MQQAHDDAPWRANFVEALGLLARAAARLPFGVPDPVLSGTSAVELYSGGLWSAAVLEVLAEDAMHRSIRPWSIRGRPGITP
jgi:hypothetical protein